MAESVEKNIGKLNLDEKKKNKLEPVNGLTKKIIGDCFDEWQKLERLCDFVSW